jgi:hypothetical protein
MSSYEQIEQFAKLPTSIPTSTSSATTVITPITTVVQVQSTENWLSMESYQWSNGWLVVTLRNVGSASVNLATADYFVGGYMDDSPTIVVQNPSTAAQFQPGSSAQFTFNVGGPQFVDGQSYVLKIVTTDGTFFEYQVVAENGNSFVATTSTTSITASVTTSAFSQVTSSNAGSEKLILDNYNWDMSKNSIWVRFGNVGTVPINLAQGSVLINGVWAATPPSPSCANLAPGWNCGFAFNPPSGNYVAGTTYTLSIQTPDGTVFSFPIVAGASG